MSLPALRQEDYETIEAAVMETSRGRWFLAEYARRNRAADTEVVLDAVGKLEKSLAASGTMPDTQLVSLVSDMGTAFETLYADLTDLRHDTEPSVRKGSELDRLTDAMDLAAQQILAANEDVQETSWAMRELGRYVDFCNKLDRSTSDISLGCSVQDLNRKRIAAVVGTIRALEKRIATLAGLVGAPLVPKQQVAQVEMQVSTTTAQPIIVQPVEIELEEELFEAPRPKLANTLALATQSKIDIATPHLSSLPRLQEALANEWSAEDDGLLMDALQEETTGFDTPIRLDFSTYSFEEKLALFS